MRTLGSYFSDYSGHHRTLGNQICHYFGIPMIAISLLGLLAPLVLISGDPNPAGILGYARLDGATLLLLFTWIWFLILDFRIGIPFAFFSMGLYVIGRLIPSPALWVIFVLGWVIQFIGHFAFEKKSPAFFKNFEHILIGPLWIFAKAVGYKPMR